MEQYIDQPTHTSGNILDLILCDREGVINAVRMKGRLGKSDHEVIAFMMREDGKREKQQQWRLNCKRANFSEMRVAIERGGWQEMSGASINGMWGLLKT